MKRNDWAGGFWAKAAAFLLAVVLVPVTLVYGAAFALSYGGELRGDFYESSICSSAVYREMSHVYDSYHYYAENGQTEVLAKYDDWYPADDRSTNVRFSIEDEAGAILFDNHRTGDIPVTGWWGEMAQDGVVFRSYIAADYPAQDSVYWALRIYDVMAEFAPNAAVVVTVCALAELLFLVFLARAAGRRVGREETVAGWQEKIPFDLYAAVVLGGSAMLVAAAASGTEDTFQGFEPIMIAVVLACCAAAYALFLAFWMTLCARVKLGRWWENTVCCWLLRLCRRILRWCWRVLCRAWGALAGFVRGIPLVWRTAVGCCVIGVLLFALESNHADGLLLMLIALLSVAACLLSMQLRRLQKGGEALAAGDLTSQVDTSHMYFDLKRHGENLNAISRGMSIAVEQKLKSERLKTELITNVSHDIKTPLTSIVNYVDLLQREHTPEQEREYLAVLDRQAHKLKKLTVDLVEMSKASTGNIPCHIARRSVRELIDQTVGEYAEKLSAARLEPVVTLPDEELYCLCDGALMWRVLDNLLSNACKYACAGTRLYIAARREGETVAFSFKNISRDALNVDPDELLERFVRGDSSRTTEGSGLGLNIAKSLVELQKGTFSIAIDGDLFKVGFILPRTE
ncbi:MAG: HAMP domain-containing sensor histidine kinase [Oscillospiraceae bacterium]|nr:HAMP domain-containing sensor histidine kinase [Oscillospiraceae bacterium]